MRARLAESEKRIVEIGEFLFKKGTPLFQVQEACILLLLKY